MQITIKLCTWNLHSFINQCHYIKKIIIISLLLGSYTKINMAFLKWEMESVEAVHLALHAGTAADSLIHWHSLELYMGQRGRAECCLWTLQLGPNSVVQQSPVTAESQIQFSNVCRRFHLQGSAYPNMRGLFACSFGGLVFIALLV